MKTHSGILKFGKREEEAMRCVIEHCRIDMSYGEGGSFNKNPDGSLDEKAIVKARRGIELFEWILEIYK